MTDTTDNKKGMVRALENSLGVVTEACRTVGISRDTHYRWLKEDDVYKTEVEAVSNAAVDFAESMLYKRMKEGSDAAIIFFLKCKAKSRGYIERQETEHSGEIKITVEEKRIS